MKTISGIEFASEHNGTDVFRLIELAYEQGRKDGHSEQLDTDLAQLGTDCISRQAAIDALDECYCGGEDSCGEPWVYKENAVEAIQMIEPIPPAEPKRGKWIHHPEIGWGETWLCDQCGEKTTSTVMGKPRANFCPNCGAKMEVTE